MYGDYSHYCEILGVEPSANLTQIKSAFRKKAKLHHPDTASGENEKAEFNKILDAYRNLVKIFSQRVFDSPLFNDLRKNEESFDYRKWLCEQDDDRSMAKLVIFDLFNERIEDSCKEYTEHSRGHRNFSLKNYFPREDFMDYGFVLAEELYFREHYYDAFLILADIIRLENEKPYFRYFFSEVISITRKILRSKLEESGNYELALDAWEDALDLAFPPEDDIFFLTKISEAYYNMGDFYKAQACKNEITRLLGGKL
ncbi:MAG: DnaJ domain-containing protein [Spirochaetaceae bacterium]|nr:DnaJ domain-containing protein [Spirochaetaceae bacterium]